MTFLTSLEELDRLFHSLVSDETAPILRKYLHYWHATVIPARPLEHYITVSVSDWTGFVWVVMINSSASVLDLCRQIEARISIPPLLQNLTTSDGTVLDFDYYLDSYGIKDNSEIRVEFSL